MLRNIVIYEVVGGGFEVRKKLSENPEIDREKLIVAISSMILEGKDSFKGKFDGLEFIVWKWGDINTVFLFDEEVPDFLEKFKKGFFGSLEKNLEEAFNDILNEIRREESIFKKFDISEYASTIGLSEGAFNILLNLMGKGTLTKDEIKEVIGFGEVENYLKELIDKGFMRVVGGVPERYEVETPYFALLKAIDRYIELLSENRDVISENLNNRFMEFQKELNNLEYKMTEAFIEKLKMKFLSGYVRNVISETMRGAMNLVKEYYLKYVYDSFKEMSETMERQAKLMRDLFNTLMELSKEREVIPFQDMWYYNSFNAIKVSINSAIKSAKSSFLVISPRLRDLDLDFLIKMNPRIRARVATHVNAKDLPILKEISKKGNINVRGYQLQDLFACIVDGEEIIIGICKEDGGAMGFGSRIGDHVKKFSILLENVWLESEPLKI
ncbi:MAG: hypothetical protein ACTSR0_01155 [Candidatus Asgardarchaeia archaeon]